MALLFLKITENNCLAKALIRKMKVCSKWWLVKKKVGKKLYVWFRILATKPKFGYFFSDFQFTDR